MMQPVWQSFGHGIIALSVVCQWASAQQPQSITWTNPPTAEEAATADEIEFVVLAREPIDEDPCETWEFIASAWEVRPRGERKITPRLRFEESHWSPDLLVRDPDCPRRDLVRLQIPEPAEPGSKPRYRVNIYSIDYTNWKATTVWQGAQFQSTFWHGDEVYVDARNRNNDQDQTMLLDDSGLVELQQSFRLLGPSRKDDDLKLVGIGPKNQIPVPAVYDASNHQLTLLPSASVHLLESNNLIFSHSDHSKQYIALHSKTDISFQGSQLFMSHRGIVTLPSVIRVFHMPTGQESWIPISIGVSFGGSRPPMPGDPIIGFDDNNRLLYWNGTDETVSRYDPEDKTTSQLTEQETESYKRMPALEDSRYIPESIHHLLASPYSDDHDVALAFLKFKGIKYTRPTTWMNTVTGFSDDTERFLLRMFGNDRSDTFFYGDLRTDLLLEIPCPPELIRANAMSIVPLR